jgi:hypothetical protein
MGHLLTGSVAPGGARRRGSRAARLIVATTILAIPGIAKANVWSRLSVSVVPGALLSLQGRYNSTATTKGIFIPGAGLGLVLRFRVSQNLFLDAGYSYNWMFFREETRPADYTADKPAWVLPSYAINGTFVFLPGGRVRPYVTLGGGVTPWWVSSRITGGTLLWFPGTDDVKFSKISWSLNSGAGIELALGSKAAVFGEARYLRIFARDTAKFGTDSFTDQSLLGIRLGLTIYLGRDSR